MIESEKFDPAGSGMLTAALTTGEDWPSGTLVPVGPCLMGQQVFGFFFTPQFCD